MAEKLNAPTPIAGSKIKKYVAAISSAKSKCDDANMVRAGLFKQAEDAGLHREALKLAAKLGGWDAAKRADFLRAWDHYREVIGLDDQGDLLEDAA